MPLGPNDISRYFVRIGNTVCYKFARQETCIRVGTVTQAVEWLYSELTPAPWDLSTDEIGRKVCVRVRRG